MSEYPAHLVRERRIADGRTVIIRPIRLDDEAPEREFFAGLSQHARRVRFQRSVGALTDTLIHFYTHIDYDRHMAFVCEAKVGSRSVLVGEARYTANPGSRSCELGIVIADDWHHTGIVQLLIDALMRAARARGFETMEGLVLENNSDMLGFVKALGFEVDSMAPDVAMVRVVKELRGRLAKP